MFWLHRPAFQTALALKGCVKARLEIPRSDSVSLRLHQLKHWRVKVTRGSVTLFTALMELTYVNHRVKNHTPCHCVIFFVLFTIFQS